MTWVVTRPVVRLSPHELTHHLINYCGQLAHMEFFTLTHSILEHIPHHLKKETACNRFVLSKIVPQVYYKAVYNQSWANTFIGPFTVVPKDPNNRRM